MFRPADSASKIKRTPVQIWLLVIIVMVGLMVAVGGITRLTGSGLSITEWKPIMGAVPPLNDGDWLAVFAKYQQIPQYKILHPAMSVGEFKWIFFWEYFHRLIGRLIGIVFLVPFVIFWVRGQITRKWRLPILSLFVLGGSQGALGWFMVMSGLSERVSVSHFRLAAHLILAFLIGAWAFWIYLRLGDESDPARTMRRVRLPLPEVRKDLAETARGMAIVLLLQILYGAFTAGLKAVFINRTFPTFNGEWFPASMTGWSGVFMNPVTVQWIHRVIGSWLLVGAILTAAKFSRATLTQAQRRAVFIFSGLIAVQYTIGVSVVMTGVPVWLGTFHQVMGYLLVLAATQFVFEAGFTPQAKSSGP